MEALIRFYLDMSPFRLTDEDRRRLEEGFDSWTGKNDWMRKNAKRIGLPEACGFIFWDKQAQVFYVQEGNGRKIAYDPGGFMPPDYLLDVGTYPVKVVSGVVYFESVAGIQNGEYEIHVENTDEVVKAVVSIETLKEGVVRHRLAIDFCSSLRVFSHVASRIRSGSETPTITWP